MPLTRLRLTAIDDGAITSAKIANGAVATVDLEDGSVTALKIADGGVDTADLADDAVTTAKIVDDAVTTAKIVDDAVTTAKIVDGAITQAKIDAGVSLGGGATGGGSDEVFYENDQTVTTNYELSANTNAMSTGPVTVDTGVTITVPTGSRYVVI